MGIYEGARGDYSGNSLFAVHIFSTQRLLESAAELASSKCYYVCVGKIKDRQPLNDAPFVCRILSQISHMTTVRWILLHTTIAFPPSSWYLKRWCGGSKRGKASFESGDIGRMKKVRNDWREAYWLMRMWVEYRQQWIQVHVIVKYTQRFQSSALKITLYFHSPLFCAEKSYPSCASMFQVTGSKFVSACNPNGMCESPPESSEDLSRAQHMRAKRLMTGCVYRSRWGVSRVFIFFITINTSFPKSH